MYSLGMNQLRIDTGRWSVQYSDRAGRTRLLGISAAGVLITFVGFMFSRISRTDVGWNDRDLLLFLVAFKADVLPGGYRILILGGAIDGLVGGT